MRPGQDLGHVQLRCTQKSAVDSVWDETNPPVQQTMHRCVGLFHMLRISHMEI